MNVPDFPLTILFSVLALAGTLVLAWLVLKFIAATYKSRMVNGEIQVRSTFSLGVKQHLYVVNFRNTDYFLGVTADKIEVLDSYPENESRGNQGTEPVETMTSGISNNTTNTDNVHKL